MSSMVTYKRLKIVTPAPSGDSGLALNTDFEAIDDLVIFNQGTWNATQAYLPNDLVVSSGTYYLCLAGNTNNASPSSAWQAISGGGGSTPTLEAVTTAGATTDQPVTLSGGASLSGANLNLDTGAGTGGGTLKLDGGTIEFGSGGFVQDNGAGGFAMQNASLDSGGNMTLQGNLLSRGTLISRTSAGDTGSGQIIAKNPGDTWDGLVQWTHNGNYSYLLHMTCGPLMSSSGSTSALIGMGIDHAGIGLLVTNKATGIGINLTQNQTITSPTAYGMNITQGSTLAPAIYGGYGGGFSSGNYGAALINLNAGGSGVSAIGQAAMIYLQGASGGGQASFDAYDASLTLSGKLTSNNSLDVSNTDGVGMSGAGLNGSSGDNILIFDAFGPSNKNYRSGFGHASTTAIAFMPQNGSWSFRKCSTGSIAAAGTEVFNIANDGVCSFTATASAPSTSTVTPTTTVYGNNTALLTTPAGWISVKINGVARVIPFY